MSEKIERQLIRLGDADLFGNKQVYLALRKIKGVSYSLSNAICIVANIPKNRRIGTLSDEELKKLDDIIKNPLKYNIRPFLFNRRKDRESGNDVHLISSNLKLVTDFDVKRMRMIKSYKGVRHSMGQPVRGQRTRSHFRKGSAVGVSKKKIPGKQGQS